LPITQVATLSGFASLRGFNAAFRDHYHLQPRSLRKPEVHADVVTKGGNLPAGLVLKASYRAPYDVAAMLSFFATRAIAGLEVVNVAEQWMARTLVLTHAGQRYTGWVHMQFVANREEVVFRIANTLAAVLPLVLARLHDMLDLNADPWPINAQLAPHFPGTEGLRVPGTPDGFELAVRAILGQQITVAAARTLASRLVARFGQPLETPFAELMHTFPTVDVLAMASGEDLGALGIVRQRQAAIIALACALRDGQLALHASADVPATMAALQALPGIGAWTANYVAMRALRWPDAFPAGDVALQKALGVRDAKHPAVEAEQASQAWRPWRSYAVLRAWSLSK
jgi:AraC family transcriptional regulator of adaptative response / DNA-3-methyladenine glycosylase II